MAREALFNLLMTRTDPEGCSVVDLFSGTGFIAYEFISRGAQHVTAVEQHRECIRFIRKTAEVLNMENLTVVQGDVFRFLSQLHTSPADIVFADPPYQLSDLESLPDTILTSGVLASDGLLIIEHGTSGRYNHHPQFREERKYGSVHFTFFSASA
jgi:16S rRNA (guanine966-N2)-methyltransferase